MGTDGTVEAVAHDCPCAMTSCALHGHCVECVRGHRTNRDHIPECLQDQLREQITALARQVQLSASEARPTPD